MRASILFATALVALAGCKADKVEIDLSDTDIQAAGSGSREMVEFEATFSKFGEMDDEPRGDMGAVESIIAKYVDVDDFELEQTDMGFEVTVEGRIPLSSDPDTAEPWFILVQPSETFPGTQRVQISNGRDFDSLEREARKINFMLAPDAFHPTQFRLDADGMDVLAPAVQVDGRYHLMWRATVTDRARMTFKGGAYESIGAGFFAR